MNKLFLLLFLVCTPASAALIINGQTIPGDVVINAPGYTITKAPAPTPAPPPAPEPPKPIPPPPPTTGCTAPTLSGFVTDWGRVFGVVWPAPVYANKYLEIPKTGYRAIKFSTGSIVAAGKISTIETTTTDGVRYGTISHCRGDFKVPSECSHVWGQGGGITWSTNGRVGACQLQPNTTYYFNVTFTDGVNGSTSSCRSYRCITRLQAVSR